MQGIMQRKGASGSPHRLESKYRPGQLECQFSQTRVPQDQQPYRPSKRSIPIIQLGKDSPRNRLLPRMLVENCREGYTATSTAVAIIVTIIADVLFVHEFLWTPTGVSPLQIQTLEL